MAISRKMTEGCSKECKFIEVDRRRAAEKKIRAPFLISFWRAVIATYCRVI